MKILNDLSVLHDNFNPLPLENFLLSDHYTLLHQLG